MNNNKCISKLLHGIVGPPPGPKFTKFREPMSIGQTPNRAKFCHPLTRSVRDICCQKFVFPE